MLQKYCVFLPRVFHITKQGLSDFYVSAERGEARIDDVSLNLGGTADFRPKLVLTCLGRFLCE